MAQDDYLKAQKLGQKYSRTCISKGEYPYLPALDSIIRPETISSGINIGIINVPAEHIVGTRTSGRTMSFAGNFMPVLQEKTEFAIKWKNLCEAHLSEGIRDAVKVYEYLNRFYVEEGHKRVSVLKYFGASEILAQVIRIMPEDNTKEEAKLYNELLLFEKLTDINFIEFSKSGRYEALIRLVGKEKNEKWNDEDRSQFSSYYYIFNRAYAATGGKNNSASTSDAFLSYIETFGYESLKSVTVKELKRNISSLSEDISLMANEMPISLNLEPEDSKTGGIISQVVNIAIPKIKDFAFIHFNTKENSSWTNNHEMGRIHVNMSFGDAINTKAYYVLEQEDALNVIQNAIDDGNKIIFTTSPRLFNASLKMAIKHPEVRFFNCSLNKPHRRIVQYYSRMYEAKFVVGAIAGTLTKSDRLGYVYTYPISGQIAGINAFALGAQMTNPDVKVYLEWSATGTVKDAVEKLKSQGISLICALDSIPLKEGNHKYFGLFLDEGENINVLAMPIWHWGIYYEEIIRRILSGSFKKEFDESDKVLNYYWGMSAKVIDILCGEKLPPSGRKLKNFLTEAIVKGECDPFMGPVYNQEGVPIEERGHNISVDDIININFLVQNVVGRIPSFDELGDKIKAVVKAMDESI